MLTPDITGRIDLTHDEYVEALRNQQIAVFVNHPAICRLCDTILAYTRDGGIAFKSAKMWFWLLPVLSLLSVFALGPFVIVTLIIAAVISVTLIGPYVRDRAFDCIIEATLNSPKVYENLIEQNFLLEHVHNKSPPELSGMSVIPASPEMREYLIRSIIRVRMSNDATMRDDFERANLTTDDFSYEEVLAWQEGLLVRHTEQYLTHMDFYPRNQHKIGRSEFEKLHVDHMMRQYNTIFKTSGYNFPVDGSVVTIEGLIAHFFRYQPENLPNKFPSYLISPSVDLVRTFYKR